MSKDTEANIEATKYARFTTGYLPADSDEYMSAYNHFKSGYSSRDKEVVDQNVKLATCILEKLHIGKEVEELKAEFADIIENAVLCMEEMAYESGGYPEGSGGGELVAKMKSYLISREPKTTAS